MIVKHGQYLTNLAVRKIRFLIVHTDSHGRIGLALAKRDKQTYAHTDTRCKRIAYSISEKVLKRQWQYDIHVLHSVAKILLFLLIHPCLTNNLSGRQEERRPRKTASCQLRSRYSTSADAD